MQTVINPLKKVSALWSLTCTKQHSSPILHAFPFFSAAHPVVPGHEQHSTLDSNVTGEEFSKKDARTMRLGQDALPSV